MLDDKDVRYVDLVTQHVVLRDEIRSAIERVLDHGQFVLGEEVSAFEREFAALCGTRHAVGLNSGLDALVLGLRALGVGPGDEVITPPNSYIASSGAIGLLGARPVFVDVGPDYNIDPERIETALTSRTKAIMPVHLTGRPAEMDRINAIAARRGISVIEDAAQAVTATYKGRSTGALGNVGCFSLHPLKTLNACGDGGVVTTDDPAVRDRLLQLRNHGLRNRDECAEWGYNSRLDSIQAAVLLVKLKYVAGWTERRRANARLYQEGLCNVGDLVLPVDRNHEYAAYHTFVVRSRSRDRLKAFLNERGVATGVHYPIPIHLQDAAAYLGYRRGDMPETEQQAAEILSLPVQQHLAVDQISYTIDCIREYYAA